MIIEVAAAAFAITLLVYSRALWCGFINLDDPFYITNNPLLKSLDGESLLRLFAAPHLGAWLPLTYLSFAIDHFFWGLNPFGYHLTNILLHAANVVLVVCLADKLFGSQPGLRVEKTPYPAILLFAGLVWGLHPLRIESVAWAAGRKDVLNGLFMLGALLAYLRYCELQDAAAGRSRRIISYLAALVLFSCSLLAKQSTVTFPFILLLLDWYPLRRLLKGRAVTVMLEKLPFLAISLLITLVTIHFAMVEKELISMKEMPLYARFFISGNAVFEYCRLTLYPVGITPYFVLPKPLPYSYLVKSAAVVIATVAALWKLPGRKASAVVWFCFVISLVPMLAFVHAGDDIGMAARYTYLASIAPSIAAAGGLALLYNRLGGKGKYLAAAAAAILLVSVAMTQKLIAVWHDTGTFWSRVIEIEPVGRAYGDRGVFYLINGRSEDAVEDFNAAINIAVGTGQQSVYNLYAFRGVGLSDIGRYAEAVADFDRAIAIYPHPTYFQQRGIALRALGRAKEAENDFLRAGPNPPPIDWFERK
jgi:Tfp pilus assembly protein PilF